MFGEPQDLAPPIVRLVGEIDHPDFRDALALLRAGAHPTTEVNTAPELIVVLQSRPGVLSLAEIERLQRHAPLAGVVVLLGSWCEGETRTVRPWPGVARIYWYDFAVWWRRQIELRAAGWCPDWARPGDCGLPIADCGLTETLDQNCNRGCIVIRAADRSTADTIADVVHPAGLTSIWQRNGRSMAILRGATTGIWSGGQLDEQEADDLQMFCRHLARDAAPVVVLLDFPRRDRVDVAREIGAAAVLGKPWRNAALLATINKVQRGGERIEKGCAA